MNTPRGRKPRYVPTGSPGGGGGDSSVLDAKYPPNTCWPEALGGRGLGKGNGGGLGGFCPGGGGGSGRVGWGGGGSRWGDLGATCPQGQVSVHHRLPFPPLALPLTIPSP